MPAISVDIADTHASPHPPANPPKILFTGANSYIALWTIQTLLERGYAIRGTVRTPDKVAFLNTAFEKYADRVEWIVVEDMTKDGIFDDAVNGVVAIVHTAAPMIASQLQGPAAALLPEEYIRPAVDGTLSLLKSALIHGNSLKRVIITSSGSAVFNPVFYTSPTQPTVTFTEENWNDQSIELVEKYGMEANEHSKYAASKTLSERAAWNFVKKHKGEIGWDLVSLCPTLVSGPILPSYPSKVLNNSLDIYREWICEPKPDDALRATIAWVDVRDTALAYLLALETESAGGERFIISAESVNWQTIRNKLHQVHPNIHSELGLPRGNTTIPNQLLLHFDATKSRRILGLRYRDQNQSLKETVDELRGMGVLVAKTG